MPSLQKYTLHGSLEKAWLRLVSTRGIGPQKAWRIYHHVKESGLDIADIFQKDIIWPGTVGIAQTLQKRLFESDPSIAEKRFHYLQKTLYSYTTLERRFRIFHIYLAYHQPLFFGVI